MRKDIIAACFLVCMLGMIALGSGAGCIRKTEQKNNASSIQAQSRPLTAIASTETMAHLKYIPYTGAGLMVLGVILFAALRKTSSAITFFGGLTMTGIFTTMAEYPLAITILTTALCLAACVMAILWLWTQKKLADNQAALKETVAVIQPHNALKSEMCGGNIKRQEEMRRIIDPIKSELRQEGVI